MQVPFLKNFEENGVFGKKFGSFKFNYRKIKTFSSLTLNKDTYLENGDQIVKK